MNIEYPTSDKQQYLLDVVEHVCSQASKHQADASVFVSQSAGYDLSYAEGAVESLEYKGGYTVHIILYVGSKQVSFSSADIRKAPLTVAMDNLMCKVPYVEDDPYVGLPDPARLAHEPIDLALYTPDTLSMEHYIAQLAASESLAYAADSRITRCESLAFSSNAAYYLYGNTQNLRAAYCTSYYSLSSCLLATDTQGDMHRDYAYLAGRTPAAVADHESVVHRAVQRTVARLGAKTMPSTQASVLFAPRVAKSLVGAFLQAISGGALYRKASFLLDAIDTPIFNDFVDIIDDPHILGGLGSSYCDGEGVATLRRHLVSQGVLKGYLLGSYSARRLGLASTGNAGGAHNIHVAANTTGGEKAMLSTLYTGLYVTELMGQGVDLLTGDYSKGAFGYWVEQGVIGSPIQTITIAGNLANMFRQVVAIGDDIDYTSSIRTGSWLIPNMTIAGQ
jgi:PmbA protein